MRRRIPIAWRSFAGLLVAAAALWGAGLTAQQPDAKKKPAAEALPTGTVSDAMWRAASTEAITPTDLDRLISAHQTKHGVKPAPRTTDEQFIRRVTLDLIGRPPTPADVKDFLDSKEADKRAKLIDKLLASEAFSRNQARYWREVVASRVSDNLARITAGQFETWLYDQFKADKKWDEIVRDVLTATGEMRFDGTNPNGVAFFLLSRRGADAVTERAAETSRVFMGVQIQCAQCHDHPSDVWKRKQFHEFAAYFGKLRERPIFEEKRLLGFSLVSAPFGDYSMPDAADAKKKGAPVSPRFLDGTPGGTAGTGGGGGKGGFGKGGFGKGSTGGTPDPQRRKNLADSVTGKNNPWFAAAFVNRTWGQLMGQSFYMPIDDLGPQKEAVFPEVIARLAGAFRGSGYDIRGLYRVILNSETYQRQIRPGESPEEHVLFAGSFPTRLRADALYQALTDALGDLNVKGGFGGKGMGKGGFGKGGLFGFAGQFRAEFEFDPSARPEDVEGSVAQALMFMNNPAINAKIKATGTNLLARVLKTYENNDEALGMVYLRALGRRPSDRELTRCREYVARAANRSDAFEDILWALINSTEFQTRR